MDGFVSMGRGREFEKRHREPIPMEEIIGLEIDFFQQIHK